MRTELLSYLTTATTSTTIKSVRELPWNTAQEPLYLKNMKKFYLGEEVKEQSVLIPTLPGSNDIMQNVTTVEGYFAVDAKNPPTGLTASITTILGAKDQIGVANYGIESDYTSEITDDVIVYTIQYRMTTIA
jgi:hypothetical protein